MTKLKADKFRETNCPIAGGWVGWVGCALDTWEERLAFWRLRGPSYVNGRYVGQPLLFPEVAEQIKQIKRDLGK